MEQALSANTSARVILMLLLKFGVMCLTGTLGPFSQTPR
jgi:hypothetical protein